jgi:F0F1-type ATP synthase epsilon subunit
VTSGFFLGHMKLISGVRMGVVKVYTGKEATSKRIFVARAIAEVKRQNLVLILAEHVYGFRQYCAFRRRKIIV